MRPVAMSVGRLLAHADEFGQFDMVYSVDPFGAIGYVEVQRRG